LRLNSLLALAMSRLAGALPQSEAGPGVYFLALAGFVAADTI
jgi:hypothetical protein